MCNSPSPTKAKTKSGTAAQRGFIVFVYTIAISMIVLVLGLAIDVGVLYVVKARLQAAADAGALAAARSLNLSLTDGAQVTDAQNAASSFFGANFPNGLWGTSNSTISTNIAYGTGQSANTLNIAVAASSRAPTYFMKWLGYSTIPLNVTGTASRRDLNLIMVLDVSDSMNVTQSGSALTSCQVMQNAALAFVGMFSNNRDTLGLVVFNGGNTVAFAPASNFNSGITSAISSIACGGYTGTADALHTAYSQLQALNNPLKLNAIILFTDGQANSITASFPLLTASDQRWGWNAGGSPYPNISTLYSMGPSLCVGGNISGVLSGDASSATTTNVTSGLDNPSNLSEQQIAGCPAGNSIRQSIAYIPSTDAYGNFMGTAASPGFRTNHNMATGTTIAGQDFFPSTSSYAGRIRPDNSQTVTNAADNATDSQGLAIRSDTTLNPMILTIGLGGNSGYPADAELLIRLANVQSGLDPSGTNTINNGSFNPAQAVGHYAYAPSAKDLFGAFQQIGSFLVELTR